VTERIAASTLALPFSSKLPDDDVSYVAESVVAAVATQLG
jgi:dTDP-4-amino-4,6-dideoxygalactose transaminase